MERDVNYIIEKNAKVNRIDFQKGYGSRILKL